MPKKNKSVSKRLQTKNKTPAKSKTYKKKKAAIAPKKSAPKKQIIILKPKKEKPAPTEYKDMALWLEKKARQDLGFKVVGRKKQFTATQKAKITRLFKGTKKKYKRKDGSMGTAFIGGLYQWRDAHTTKIKSDKQRKILNAQGAKIAGDIAYIPRRQKSEKLTVLADGARVRRVGGTTFKTYPLTHDQITDIHEDPENASEWLQEYIGPVGSKRTARIEYTNGFGNNFEDIDLLVKSSGFANTTANQKIIGIVITEHKGNKNAKKKAKRKKKKGRRR